MIVLIRGGGDLASGVALRLHHVGFRVVITELPHPLAVRRLVSFSEAINCGETTIEEVTARRVTDIDDTLRVLQIIAKSRIPVLVDPDARAAQLLHPSVIVDARMRKLPPEPLRHNAKLYVGLGPGFIAPENCHAAIETRRGHWLGRVIWQGSPSADTGIPETVGDRSAERVLRAPADGALQVHAQIGDHLEAGQLVAEVSGQAILAPFKGVLRGLLPADFPVRAGIKIGDIDPRDDPAICSLVSDKSLAVGGGVLEAILAKTELRPNLWSN
jgi:xanthine dehydrogenase accessory factor